MCDPTTIAISSLALAAGSTAYGVSENMAATSDKNRADQDAATRSNLARTTEMQRQDKMSKAAWDNWQAQLAASAAQPMEQAVDTNAQQATDTAARAGTQSGLDMGMLPGAERQAPELSADVAKRTNVAATRARQRIAAMAQLSGYAGAGTDAAVRNQQFGNNLALDNSNRAASLGISRLEGSTVPANIYGPSPLAGGLAQLGQLGVQYAGSRGAYNGLLPAPTKTYAPSLDGGPK